jgi:predicted Zn-dependent protease
VTTPATTPQEIVERALELSTADGCVAIADEQSTANLRWAGNTLTTNGMTLSRQLTVISTVEGSAGGVAAGVISRSNVTMDRIEELVRAAEAAARSGPPADDAQPLVSPDQVSAPTLWEAPPAETSIQVFSAFAPALGEAFGRARADRRDLYGFAQHLMTTTYLGTTTGVRLRHDQPTGTVEITGKADGASVWLGASTRDFSDIDVDALDGDVSRRLEWSKRHIELEPGRYETVLPPSAVADLMIYMYWSAGGRDAHDGHTVFSRPGGGTRIGEQLASVPVTLRSDPSAEGLSCAPFVLAHASGRTQSVFDNGLALAPTGWVSDGKLGALIHTRASAAETGDAVAPPIDNLIMEGPPGDPRSLGDMVASTRRGILVTCLWYIREVDPQTLLLTGLTRDGVYLVEDGEVAGAVNNFRFNESPVDLLGRLGEVGQTEIALPREWSDWFTRTAMPPIRVGDFNMSTVSQAS